MEDEMSNYMEIVTLLNLERKGNTFVGEVDGYRFSFGGLNNSALIGGVFRFVFTQPIPDAAARTIRKYAKAGYGRDRFAQKMDTAVVFAPRRGRRTNDEYAAFLKQTLGDYVRGFKEAGLYQPQDCTVCHTTQPESEPEWKTFNGYYVPMHSSCAERMIEQVNREVQSESKRWMLLPLSLLFALLGGIVGLIPALIALFTVNYYVGLLYALIPLGAVVGYKIGKAPKNAMMIVSVILITLFLSAGFVLATYAMSAEYLGFTFAEALQSEPGFADAFERDISTSVIFGALGVWIAWRGISKTTRGKLNAVQSLKNQ
jgi:hypothetical protein